MRSIVGQTREISPGVFEVDHVVLVQHADHCPLRQQELPALGVYVSDVAGVTGKAGG
jgi:hypothetical protein